MPDGNFDKLKVSGSAEVGSLTVGKHSPGASRLLFMNYDSNRLAICLQGRYAQFRPKRGSGTAIRLDGDNESSIKL